MSQPGDAVMVLPEHMNLLARTGRLMPTVATAPHIQRLLRLTAPAKALSVPSAIAACVTRFGGGGTGIRPG